MPKAQVRIASNKFLLKENPKRGGWREQGAKQLPGFDWNSPVRHRSLAFGGRYLMDSLSRDPGNRRASHRTTLPDSWLERGGKSPKEEGRRGIFTRQALILQHPSLARSPLRLHTETPVASCRGGFILIKTKQLPLFYGSCIFKIFWWARRESNPQSVKEHDFESCAYTSSATRPYYKL